MALSSQSATLIVSGNATDRETLLQNPSPDYDIYIASYSVLLSSTGPRAILRKSSDIWTNNTDDIYAILGPGGSSVSVLGVTEYHSKDLR